MAYRYGQRQQHMLLPPCIEDFVPENDPVRVYDAFVDALPWDTLGIDYEPNKVGCPQFDPQGMLKILVYGYSYGVRSSRKLERALHHNLSFIWLAGGLKPDHKTIAEFRRRNKRALKNVIKQCARLCLELDLIAGNTLFVDGSKFRANACIDNTRTQEGCEAKIAQLDKRIEQLLQECEQADQSEEAQGSFVKLKEELVTKQDLKAKVEGVLETLQSQDLERMNTTDPDCVPIHGRQGSHAGYSAQIVVDEQHGLIVNGDVVNKNNDLGQFADQIEQAHETLDAPCQVAAADSGYCNAVELEKIDRQNIKVIVPTQQQAGDKAVGPFDKSRFQYLPEEDCYVCPEGKRLTRHCYDTKAQGYRYSAGRAVCSVCPHFGVCTKNKSMGREFVRYDNQAVRDKLAAQYEQADSQVIFSRRKETAELPFGHFKRNLGADHFLLRGLDGVRAEMSILCSCFNVVRLIGLYGVPALMKKLAHC